MHRPRTLVLVLTMLGLTMFAPYAKDVVAGTRCASASTQPIYGQPRLVDVEASAVASSSARPSAKRHASLCLPASERPTVDAGAVTAP